MSSLKLCVTGGSAMPADFIPVFEQKFGVRILEGYGLTEASPACSFNRIEAAAKPGSIGTALTGIDIKIVDDAGNELPRNEIGELIVRGENVMKGYYKDDAATASVIKNGWLYTGDLGRMDEEDYIFLTGRKKRMIITSGFNVYPREVETILNLHPAVKDSRVSGKKDLMRGEIVKAQIVLQDGSHPDDKEIIRHCKTYLSPYKVPREVEFVTEIFRIIPTRLILSNSSYIQIHQKIYDFPTGTISISDGSYSWGFSYPRRFRRVAAILDRPFSLISAIRYSP